MQTPLPWEPGRAQRGRRLNTADRTALYRTAQRRLSSVLERSGRWEKRSGGLRTDRREKGTVQAEPEDCCEDGSPGHTDSGRDSPGQVLPRKVQTAQDNRTEEPADDIKLKPCLFPFSCRAAWRYKEEWTQSRPVKVRMLWN